MGLDTATLPGSDQLRATDDLRLVALASEIERELDLNPETALTKAAHDATLRMAASVDTALSRFPAAEVAYADVLAELLVGSQVAAGSGASAIALDRVFQRYSPAFHRLPARLGVCPAVMSKALALLRREQTSLQEM